MTRRKRALYLMLAACLMAVVAWLLSTSSRPEPVEYSSAGSSRTPSTATTSNDLRYSITHKHPNAPGVAIVDKSFQFTFSGDPTISPGSLEIMTLQMHASEIEIATRLARDIKFPSPP